MDAKTTEAVELLRRLIATPSTSRDESRTADLLFAFLEERGAAPERLHNNVFARSADFDPARPTLLLNSHHDTVRPAASYTRDPFTPTVEGDRLYGLGSNDAGASVVSLARTFLTFREQPLPFNLLLALSAEEECMGEHGMRALLPQLGAIDMALVGEPTGMQAAAGERGLVVLDCEARGKSGHAARNEGINALYIALDDIARLRSFRFDRVSELLGPIGIAVTQIAAGTQHNVVPDSCRFVVDLRTTDAYTNEETVEILRGALRSQAVPRSTRIRASALDAAHPLARAAQAAGRRSYVSPTTSDMALMPFPSLKMGPGESSRSHTADEYVLLPDLVQQVFAALDGSGHQLGEEGHEGGVNAEMPLRPNLAAVDVDHVAEGLEGVKGDADGQCKVQQGDRSPCQAVHGFDGKICIFEKYKQAQADSRRYQKGSLRCPLFSRLSEPADKEAAGVRNKDGTYHQDQVNRFSPCVEEKA